MVKDTMSSNNNNNNIIKFPSKGLPTEKEGANIAPSLEGLIEAMVMVDPKSGEMVLVTEATIDEMLGSVEEDAATGRTSLDTALHEHLVDDSYFLNCLMEAGVDKWVGYEGAIEEYMNSTYGKFEE